MKIVIDKNFIITKIPDNWVLNYSGETYKRVMEKGKEPEDVVKKDYWYYPTIKVALIAYIDKRIGTSESKNLQEILSIIEEIDKTVNNIKL